jgi:hypothetical protein
MPQGGYRAGSLAAGASLLVAGVLVLGLSLMGPPRLEAQGAAQKSEAGKRTFADSQGRTVRLRDPFRSLVRKDEEEQQALPPGKRGLVISRLTINGIVAGREEKIAVVTMRGRNRAYFLRERDQVFEGYVARISDDGVVFKERTTDAFGTPYEREVTKRISGSGANR